MYTMDDAQDHELNVLDILQEMYETEREFLNAMRLLNVQTRNDGLVFHLRMQDRVIHMLNRHITMMERRPETRVVMNIPLNMNEARGFWDAINVSPSPEQINRAVERMAVPPQDTICSICQDPLAGGTRILHCNHFFHGNCINEWFEQSPRCPVCRYDIRDYQPPAPPANMDA